ncbi:putative syntaxin-5 [Benincasa hispida]|uniref:putative syntaxin-5 n=1 Tax=Benincasa hispida TaxID=102211 RepID=UPI001902A53A|nr:putative syntaxin-5 [Benincasa hispida]
MAVLKVLLHCQGCIEKIQRVTTKFKGCYFMCFDMRYGLGLYGRNHALKGRGEKLSDEAIKEILEKPRSQKIYSEELKQIRLNDVVQEDQKMATRMTNTMSNSLKGRPDSIHCGSMLFAAVVGRNLAIWMWVVVSLSILENNKCYLLDCGAEIFVWVGRVTQVEERKATIQVAEEAGGWGWSTVVAAAAAATAIDGSIKTLKDTYMQSRAEALQNVESTIHELSNIFNQLAILVSKQGEIAIRFSLMHLFQNC